jgi:hypothetical protein
VRSRNLPWTKEDNERWATIDREVAGPGRAGCVQLTPNSLDCLPLEQFSDVSLPGSLPVDGRPLSRGTCVLLYAKTINSLAGKEAERLLSGRFTEISSSSDMLKATFLASYFPEPASFLGHARRDAASILAARRHQVEAVAEALIEDKTLDRADIDDVLSEFSPALRVERARRRQWAAMAATAEQFRMMTGGLVRLDGVCAT